MPPTVSPAFNEDVYFCHHLLLQRRVNAAQWRVQVCTDRLDLTPRRCALGPNVAHLNRVTGNFRSKMFQQYFCKRAGSYARRSFAGGSTFQHIPCIVKIEFLRTGKISVPGSRRYQLA